MKSLHDELFIQQNDWWERFWGRVDDQIEESLFDRLEREICSDLVSHLRSAPRFPLTPL